MEEEEQGEERQPIDDEQRPSLLAIADEPLAKTREESRGDGRNQRVRAARCR